MLAVWLKALHIASLALWTGGLLALPGLLVREQRVAVGEPGIDEVWQHRLSRFAYDLIVSPAAVVAIGSGTALIFVTRPLDGWLFIKLAAVAGLAMTHMAVGRSIDSMGERTVYSTSRLASGLRLTALLFICLILWLVLQKPAIPTSLIPDWLLERPAALPWPLAQSGFSIPFTPT